MLKAFLKRLVPPLALDWYHRWLAFFGALYYRFPSRRLVVIGVTGTKGKTTTVHLIARILEQAGYKVGAASSICFKIGAKVEMNRKKMTMPGRFFLQKLLRRMVSINCRYAVIEVTSEGVRQHRQLWIDFDTVVFTNISPEHLESHGGFAPYLAAKREIFRTLAQSRRVKRIRSKHIGIPKTIVANGDDEYAEEFLSFPADRRYCFHLSRQSRDEDLVPCEDVVADVEETSQAGSYFTIRNQRFRLPLPGRFNVSNALAAIAVGLSEDVALSRMAETLGSAEPIPGRMEYIAGGQPFTVVVDYAHTPASLEAVYRALTAEHVAGGPGRLICLLGAAGGGRDRWKRPVLGAIAGLYGDAVLVTNEDPYDEEPLSIMREVGRGVESARDVYRGYAGEEALEMLEPRKPPLSYVLDRREAIERALTLAHPGDTVVITGKGAEQAMVVAGGKKIPWDDRAVVRETLARLRSGT